MATALRRGGHFFLLHLQPSPDSPVIFAVNSNPMHSLRLFVLFLSVAGFAHASGITDLYEQSEFWPPRAALSEPFVIEGSDKAVPAGREGVVIRLEAPADPVVILDFGRNGVGAVPLAMTDFRKRAEALAANQSAKEMPNWTMMLGRGFVELSGGVPAKAPLNEKLARYKRMLVVYLKQPLEAKGLIGPFLEENRELLQETGTLTVVFAMEPISESDLGLAMQEMELDAYFMLPFLSEAYAASMSHGLEDYPAAALTDVEGKTLYLPEEGDAFADTLDAVRIVLDGLKEPAQE